VVSGRAVSSRPRPSTLSRRSMKFGERLTATRTECRRLTRNSSITSRTFNQRYLFMCKSALILYDLRYPCAATRKTLGSRMFPPRRSILMFGRGGPGRSGVHEARKRIRRQFADSSSRENDAVSSLFCCVHVSPCAVVTSEPCYLRGPRAELRFVLPLSVASRQECTIPC